jgi:DNA replication protein DnaC
VIPDPTVADAVLDRLVHTAHRLALKGESLRKPSEKTIKRGRLDTNDAE